MANYRLSNEAKNDLIRIYQYGISQFGVVQADAYFDAFFVCFNNIAERPFSFESWHISNQDIDVAFVVQIPFILR